VGVQRMDADTAESMAGVVRLLRRAAELAWDQADLQGPGSPRQLLALGIDLAADEARNLVADAVDLEGPTPVGADPAGLLRSAEQLLRRLCVASAPARMHSLHVSWAQGSVRHPSARQGATTKELMRRLGHATPDMAMRYQRADAERDRALARAMSDGLSGDS
jgi:hypothetical protein